MKKIVLCLMATCLSLMFLPLQANASTTAVTDSLAVPTPAESAEAKSLLLRLNEIKAMDKSKLTSSEKKNLRAEVRSTRTHLRGIGGGVYLSVGAIIIIVLLLVILL